MQHPSPQPATLTLRPRVRHRRAGHATASRVDVRDLDRAGAPVRRAAGGQAGEAAARRAVHLGHADLPRASSTQLTEDLDYFAPDGTPLHAKVSVTHRGAGLRAARPMRAGAGDRGRSERPPPSRARPPPGRGARGRAAPATPRPASSQAHDGESVQQLLARLGEDPAAWRAAMTGWTARWAWPPGAPVQLGAGGRRRRRGVGARGRVRAPAAAPASAGAGRGARASPAPGRAGAAAGGSRRGGRRRAPAGFALSAAGGHRRAPRRRSAAAAAAPARAAARGRPSTCPAGAGAAGRTAPSTSRARSTLRPRRCRCGAGATCRPSPTAPRAARRSRRGAAPGRPSCRLATRPRPPWVELPPAAGGDRGTVTHRRRPSDVRRPGGGMPVSVHVGELHTDVVPARAARDPRRRPAEPPRVGRGALARGAAERAAGWPRRVRRGGLR